eukprot:160489_1
MSTNFANNIIPQILNAKDYAGCLWININDIYDIQCDGNCKFIENTQQNVSFLLDITFEDEDGAALTGLSLTQLCNSYFSNINDTESSIDSIDVIFIGVLTILKATTDEYKVINELTKLPYTELRNALQYLECNEMQQPLKLQTSLTLEMETQNEETAIIYTLFKDGSEFAIQSELLIEELFQSALTINITIIDEIFIPNESTGIAMEIVLAVCIGGFCIIIILIAFIIILKQRRKRQREAATIYMSNPMIIAVAIGIYDKPPSAPEIDEHLQDLNGVDQDIVNINELYKETLKYNVYPNYDTQNGIREHWTKDDIVKLLKQKAKDLNDDIDKYDGLVVFVSCHGDNDYFLSSDYKKLYKLDIHRTFSVDYPSVRTIPRVFCFDCCAGSQMKEHETRNEIDEERREIAAENDDNNIPNEMAKNLSIKDVHTTTTSSNSEPHLAQQNSVLWAGEEVNPDYRLVVINSSNQGFQSKLTSDKGSYCIQKLTEKIRNNFLNDENEKFLVEIVHQVQTELHDTGKQLIDATFNNRCDYIKFKENNQENTAQFEGNTSGNVEMETLNQE